MSKKYFYNPTFNNHDTNGDGFYSSTKSKIDDYYKKYLALKEKLKNNDIDVEDDEDDEYSDELAGCWGDCKECTNQHKCPAGFLGDDCGDSEGDVEDDGEDYSPMYDSYEERQVDLLSLPVYYHIAFAIPADLSFGSETARRIEAIYKLKPKLEKAAEEYENECEDLEEGWTKAGDVVKIENVYVMFTTNKKYQHPTLDTIRECVRTLAQDCYKNKIQFLAMPRIGCGHGRLDWDVVRELILDEFDNYFYDVGEINWRPYITFCYQ